MSESDQTPAPAKAIILPEQMLPPNLFILPVNSAIIFPTLMAPLFVSHPKHVATVEEAISRNRLLGLLLTREDDLKDQTQAEGLYSVGVVVKIVKRIKMSDGSVNLLLHSMRRFKAKKTLSEDPYLVVETEYLDDETEKSNEMDALTRTVVSHVKKLSETNPFFTEEMKLAMINAPGPGTIADLVAFSLSLPKPEAQDFLETLSVKARYEKLLIHLRHEQDVADLQRKITEEVNSKLTKMQREFFLKEQLKSIKKELGLEEEGKEKSSRTIRERIESVGMPDDIKKIALEELEKFETLAETSGEYNVMRTYLETLVSLPWSEETKDQLDLSHARKVLHEDHDGLEKVKARILEFLAVRKLKIQKGQNPKGSILCLVGPPGVGKTSIGKSVAKALGRKFYRFSLGGLRDEAEIKGHRRTYVGAMPGKFIQAMKRAGAKNAVILLDEIDKLGASFQGDPASALLEVLDPEQNHQFIDHYLDVPFDLSKVLFISTANTLSTIPAPLLDRMEIIELSGYTLEEKESIAARHLIPKELDTHGLEPKSVQFSKQVLRKIIRDYAREPGLRQLQQAIGRISRQIAMERVESAEKKRTSSKSKKDKSVSRVLETSLTKYLGPKRYYNEVLERIAEPGVVVGMAWTQTGGDILFIEATDLLGTGHLNLTGQMGDVMQESAQIAWSYVKKKAVRELNLDLSFLKEKDIHLHLPAGAIPKDGPSAGITMATALYSLLSGRMIRHKWAMTGELSLVGKVLPVGGIKEKLLAARRSGVTDVILPALNKKDVEEMTPSTLKGLNIHYVKKVDEVFDLVLAERGRSIIKRRDSGTVLTTQKKSEQPSRLRE